MLHTTEYAWAALLMRAATTWNTMAGRKATASAQTATSAWCHHTIYHVSGTAAHAAAAPCQKRKISPVLAGFAAPHAGNTHVDIKLLTAAAPSHKLWAHTIRPIAVTSTGTKCENR
jgi:hypothetical protein